MAENTEKPGILDRISEALERGKGFMEGADPRFVLGGALSLPLIYALMVHLSDDDYRERRSLLSKLLRLGALAGAGGVGGAAASYGYRDLEQGGRLIGAIKSLLGLHQSKSET